MSQYSHGYGPNVHILANPVLQHLINKISSIDTPTQEVAQGIKWIYRLMLYEALPLILDLVSVTVKSRMATSTPRGVYQSLSLNPEAGFITAALARAGILPSQLCFEEIQALFGYQTVWQDHFFCARTLDSQGAVIGTRIIGAKLGGSIQDKTVLIPDPMGATGLTVQAVLGHYLEHAKGKARKFVILPIITTPEYLRLLTDNFPNCLVITARLDRGLSSSQVLGSSLGQFWEIEKGLNPNQYVVPGLGGLGELLNNTAE
jgi:uracil phosphoribosyltransferase